MTLTILVSFSLLALVVTARPIVPRNAPQLAEPSRDVRNAVQAIFRSRTGHPPDCLTCDDKDVRVHVSSPEEQNTVLSDLAGLDAVKAILPLGPNDEPTESERQLYDLLNKQQTASLNDLDGGERTPRLSDGELVAEDLLAAEDSPSQPDVVPPMNSQRPSVTPPLLVLAFSAIASLLVLMCVVTAVYITKQIRAQLMRSDMIWNVLPKLEKGISLEGDAPSNEDGSEKYGGVLLLEKGDLIDFDGTLAIVPMPGGLGRLAPLHYASDTDSEAEDYDEKFADAEDSLLLGAPAEERHPLPTIVTEHPDPELMPLPASPTPWSTPEAPPPRSLASSPLMRPVQMRERPASPVSRPAWSVRAADAPALGLSTSMPTIPGALYPEALTADSLPPSGAVEMAEVPRRQRAYRAPVPELDIAFALQLRPGLGLGADPAWLVRFLMAMFGWMTVLIGGGGGGGRRETVQRI